MAHNSASIRKGRFGEGGRQEKKKNLSRNDKLKGTTMKRADNVYFLFYIPKRICLKLKRESTLRITEIHLFLERFFLGKKKFREEGMLERVHQVRHLPGMFDPWHQI